MLDNSFLTLNRYGYEVCGCAERFFPREWLCGVRVTREITWELCIRVRALIIE